MQRTMADDKKKCMQQLSAEFKKKLPKEQVALVTAFADHFFSHVPVEDLAGKSIDDVYGQTLSVWKFIQSRDGDKPKISVCNPSSDKDGWQTGNTVVMVLHSDKAFLVDSVRMELTREDINIHGIQNIVFQADRDKKSKLVKGRPCGYEEDCKAGDSIPMESLMYFEIDRIPSAKAMKALEGELANVLGDVGLVVNDFSAMKAKVEEILAEWKENPPPGTKADREEAETYLNWLLSNFTFLGYKHYKLTNKDGKKYVQYPKGTTLGIVNSKGEKVRSKFLSDLSADARKFVQKAEPLGFAKSGTISTVHRPAYPDYVAVKVFNKKGEVVGEHGFLGLYTLSVYTQRTSSIPVIRRKTEAVMKRSGLQPGSHDAKELARVLETYPRDELFQTDADELFSTAMGIAHIKERHQTRLFVRKDHYGKFFSCMVYLPRETYNTETRTKVENILCGAFKAQHAQFTTYFGESVLVRTHYILRTDPKAKIKLDVAAVERDILSVTRSWQDDLAHALVAEHGEEEGVERARQYQNSFPLSYRDNFMPATAVHDVDQMIELTDEDSLGTWFYQRPEQETDTAHFSLYHKNTFLPLSDIIPVLENMGLKVIGEHPYKIESKDGDVTWIHDFDVTSKLGEELDAAAVNDIFTQAFEAVWDKDATDDSYNRLVLAAQLDWRTVTYLRALGRYMKQIRIGLSQAYIADTLIKYLNLTNILVDHFNAKFDPALQSNQKKTAKTLKDLEAAFMAGMDEVQSLSEDRVLRRYMEINKAMLRTNFFQPDPEGNAKNYISFKLNPRMLPDIPQPRPMFEIFVYSDRVEGCHFRGGKVARGGLRWSDRMEDFRTEVLGLVKAQQVKNSVIVPVGAKGCFVSKRAAQFPDREGFLAEGIGSYKTFVSGLLDVTDNLVQGEISPPNAVVRTDPDDPYLVVAADKGTATFSDISNGLADDYGFWLGDAFASGGSQGYDHKGMGITAKGAWVSVQRHFREKGIDVQKTEFTVAGVGDMGGDVFGNGMMLSDCIQLVAAFNHLHIFIDPNPNAAKTAKERKRLFETPRTTWGDFNAKLISEGGGIFDRAAKSIDISPQMQKRFDIKAKQLTPNELLNAILKSPVDLIWNGGIGTYVKGTSESHADVGDKANDAIRVNGKDLKAKVLGEGGNLGATQLGRIEFAMNGGACYTDFIDNAGGVDCSDHEVNIKILLNAVMSESNMTEGQRNKLLASMTDDVSDLVLNNNYRQTQAISIAYSQAGSYFNELRRFINVLEEEGKLDRALEYLPSEVELDERKEQGQTLTLPEISLLVSYAKAELKEALVETAIPEDAYLARIAETAFPPTLVKKYKKQMYEHRLLREIVATQLGNDVVNTMGITFVNRLRESTSSSIEQVMRAYVMAREIFNMPTLWKEIEMLDNKVPAAVQIDMMSTLMRLVRHGTRWMLKHRRSEQDMETVIKTFAPSVTKMIKSMGKQLCGEPLKEWEAGSKQLVKDGVPKALADQISASGSIYFALDIVDATAAAKVPLENVSSMFFSLADRLDIHGFRQQVNHLPVGNHWHALVRDSLRDDVDSQLGNLTKAVLKLKGSGTANARIDKWMADNDALIARWKAVQTDLKRHGAGDFAMYTVAIRELMELERED